MTHINNGRPYHYEYLQIRQKQKRVFEQLLMTKESLIHANCQNWHPHKKTENLSKPVFVKFKL
jgi:hypothetical protein